MHTLRTLSLLSASSALQCFSCRNAPAIALRELQQQCYTDNSRRHSSSFSPAFQPSSGVFTYRIGASFSGKGRQFNGQKDLYTFVAEKAEQEFFTGWRKSGQDAFFISSGGGYGDVAFGVADGVGGWSDSGIDSAFFSHGLCQKMASIAHRKFGSEDRKLSPKELLQEAYDVIVEEQAIEGGGSTACVAVGDGDGNLQVANLGDSGYIQLRLNAVHHFSNPQTHAFNTPYQLSVVPPKILRLTKLFGGDSLHDMPGDSNVATHKVRHGDVVVFATDGVWDNLSTAEILKVVSRVMGSFQAWRSGGKGTEVSEILDQLTQEGGIPERYENTLQTLLAVNIVREAKAASVDERRDGPFAREVKKHYPQDEWHGGKVDDICVVVAIVVETVKDQH